MGWLMLIALGALLIAGMWKFGRFDRAALQFLAAGILLAMAGYAWQGSPGLAGKPLPPPKRQQLADTEFSKLRGDMLGEVDAASRWLTLAEMYQREGDTQSAANVIRSGLRSNDKDADLWVGLGNALVIHADGMMTPAAELAFRRAERIAPEHPGPKFFYGLALAQTGKLDEAERMWRGLLASGPADAAWRPSVEAQLAALAQTRAMQGMAAPQGGVQQR
jgi:cytochrome c-type biogenesis protein CcmH/NrfG